MFDENRIIRIYSLVNNFLEDYRENIEACGGRRDYFALVVSILIFRILVETHFKEDYDKTNKIANSNDMFSSLDDIAHELAEKFLKEHANKTLN